MDTLFGHLVTKFGSAQAENLATEGLNYLLGRFAEARRLLLRFLEHSGRPFPSDLSFGTQSADSNGNIPDLSGRDPDGIEVVILEAKFWAALTARQPTGYLTRLPPDGLLVFVAPALRFESLWQELLARCREAGHSPEEEGPWERVAYRQTCRRATTRSHRMEGDTGRASYGPLPSW